jgi:hypothetical protein
MKRCTPIFTIKGSFRPDLANFRRFGEFSPIWRSFAFVSVLKMTEVAQIFGLLVSTVTDQLCINFDQKWLGRHIGRLFSQTHLVTLVAHQFEAQIKTIEKAFVFSKCHGGDIHFVIDNQSRFSTITIVHS